MHPCTLGMPNIPPLEENQQSAPFLLTLPNVMTTNVMEPPMSTPCKISTTTIPIDAQRKSLIDITPIPKRNAPHCQVNMMSQAETSNTQRCQSNNTNMVVNSQGHNQPPRQHQPAIVPGPNTSNKHGTYQQHQSQQQQPQVVYPAPIQHHQY